MEIRDYLPTYLNSTSLRYAKGKYTTTAEEIVTSFDKEQLIEKIKNFKGRFKLDFKEDYLNGLSENKLRHILLAAYVADIRPAIRQKRNKKTLDTSL